MPRLRATTICLFTLLLTSTCSAGGFSLEARVAELQQQAQDSMKEQDREGALVALGRIAELDPDHPKLYLQIVLFERRLGELEDAPALMDSLGSSQSPGRLYGLGLLSFFQADAANAERQFSAALEAYRAREHAAGQAACHSARGNLYRRARALDAAEAEYRAASRLLEQIDDRRGLADALSSLAKTERAHGRPAEAARSQRRVLSLREALGDVDGQARSWHEIGLCLHEAGDGAGAAQALERALALRGDLQDRRAQITTLRELARVRFEMGDADRARASLAEAERIARQIPDPKLQAEVQLQQGTVLLSLGRNAEAKQVLESSANLFYGAGRPAETAQALRGLGTALTRNAEFLAAGEALGLALQQARRVEQTALEATVLTELGNVQVATGELTRGLLAQERALELHRGLGDSAGVLANLNNLGVIYFSLGDSERARSYIEGALEQAVELGDATARGRGHNNLGVLLAEEQRLDVALEELQRAAELWDELDDTRGVATARANMADALFRLGRAEAAAQHLEQALEGFRAAQDRRGECSALNQFGELRLSAGDAQAAARDHRRALAIARDHEFPDEEWRAHAGLSRVLEAEGKLGGAREEALLAIDRIEEMRARLESDTFKMGFLADKVWHYERALELLTDDRADSGPDAVAAAFRVAERARARSLLDVLAETRQQLGGLLDPALREREARLLDALGAATVDLARADDDPSRAAARARLDGVAEELERLKLEIRRSAPGYGAILYPAPASLEEVQQGVLRDDEVLLEYFVGRGRAWLWVVQQQKAELHRLPHPDEIRAQVEAFLEQMSSSGAALGGRSPGQAVAERLGRAILPPGALPAQTRLVVAPDGPLHLVPFDALRRDGRFLVETHEVVVVPSATTLRLMRRHPTAVAAGGFLGIGAPLPDAAGDSFPELPFAAAETLAIADLFPEGQRRVLTGSEATKARIDALELERFRYVHFATHGWLDAARPAHSGLQLTAAEGDADAALLTVNEILGRRLAAELVVLSACRSGLGELRRGEGLVGLTRAFLYAGAQGVVVSLWNVNDRSSAEFMQAFYRALRADAAPAVALRQAKLGFLQSDRAALRRTRNWAPFVLVGDPGADDPKQTADGGGSSW